MSVSAQDALTKAAEAEGLLSSWAPVQLPGHVRERYESWLGARRHATMGELLRGVEVRFDPLQRFGWVRSALVLAAPHGYQDPGEPTGGTRIGRVGRVFWVREQEFLERLLRPRLDELRRTARELGVRCRDWIDQGPLPLRSHAANAAVGWIGRNAMLIAPGLGSYLTLAVILTDVEVAPVAAQTDMCGSCRRCLPSCPSGALRGDGTLDANRCASYWTTQHPGLIPPGRWQEIGDWLFGCDICQQVCPWNGKADRWWQGYRPEADLAHPDLATFFSAYADGHEFRRRYAGSAFERAGRTRMARNALIVAANSRQRDLCTIAYLGAGDLDPVVRATAAHCLARLGRRDSLADLLADRDPTVREHAELALSRGSGAG